jgi:hypothetical protein
MHPIAAEPPVELLDACILGEDDRVVWHFAMSSPRLFRVIKETTLYTLKRTINGYFGFSIGPSATYSYRTWWRDQEKLLSEMMDAMYPPPDRRISLGELFAQVRKCKWLINAEPDGNLDIYNTNPRAEHEAAVQMRDRTLGLKRPDDRKPLANEEETQHRRELDAPPLDGDGHPVYRDWWFAALNPTDAFARQTSSGRA